MREREERGQGSDEKAGEPGTISLGPLMEKTGREALTLLSQPFVEGEERRQDRTRR